MTAEIAGTSLITTAVQGALSKKDATAQDVLAAMYAAELQEIPQALAPSQPLPKAVSVSPEQEAAISNLIAAVTRIEFPKEVRKLDGGELVALMYLRGLADQAQEVVDSAKTSIRDAVMNHFDRVAEEEGKVDATTYLTDEYHYVIKDRASGGVLGMAKKFVRTVRRGKVTFGTPVAKDDYLQALLDAGELDRPTYLRWTRAVRIVEPEKMFQDMKDPRLMGLIRKATRVGKPTAAMEIAVNDGEDE